MGIDCRKSIKTIILLTITLVLLISPQIHSIFINQTFSKGLYPDNSYIITTTPTATFPNDHNYCYIGQNNLDVTVILNNVDYPTSITDKIDSELHRADININWNFVDWNMDTEVYFDFEYELKLNEYRDQYSSNYVIALTNMVPPADGEYYNLGGYARLQNHCAIIFTETLGQDTYVSAIMLHELSHLLGYWHSEDASDVMYPTYNGGNNEFTQTTVDILYELHH